MAVASHLVRPPRGSSDSGTSLAAYLALLRLGVTLPRPLPAARWALTPPFHPCPWIKGGLFSVALSVAFRRPGVTWQSALWSSDFPRNRPTLPRPATTPPHQTPVKTQANGPALPTGIREPATPSFSRESRRTSRHVLSFPAPTPGRWGSTQNPSFSRNT